MATLQYKYDLDMGPGKRFPTIVKLSQYDEDFELIFRLHSEDGALDVRNATVGTVVHVTTAEIRGTKSDGNGYSATCDVGADSDGTPTVTFVSADHITVDGDKHAQQMTAVAGKTPFELTLYHSETEDGETTTRIVSTGNFLLEVERSPLDLDTLPSDSKIRELYEIDDHIDEIIDAAEALEDDMEWAQEHFPDFEEELAKKFGYVKQMTSTDDLNEIVTPDGAGYYFWNATATCPQNCPINRAGFALIYGTATYQLQIVIQAYIPDQTDESVDVNRPVYVRSTFCSNGKMSAGRRNWTRLPSNVSMTEYVDSAIAAFAAQIIDDELEVSGKAADAKATGDMFGLTLRQLASVPSNGEANDYAEENGWRAVPAGEIGHYPFTNGGLLINYVPKSTNARYQIALPYSVNDSVSTRRRTAGASPSWGDWTPTSEKLKDKVVIGRTLTTEYPIGEDDTSPVYDDDGVTTVQLDMILTPGNYILDRHWNVIDSPLSGITHYLKVDPYSPATNHRFTRQMVYDATDPFGKCYVRQADVSAVFGSWVKLPSGGVGTGESKMLVQVNSTLAGATWINNPDYDPTDPDSNPFKSLGNQPWGKSPYSQLAMRLGVANDGVNVHGETVMHSSTGLLYAPSASEGSFIDLICGNQTKGISAIPLTDYDSVFTVFWWHDVAEWSLGTVDDAATANTIAGGVHKLVNYMTDSNSSCRLILASVIPDRVNVMWGDNVFNYDLNGQTIAQLDTLMHQMAAKYHFTYIDYQDMNLSYHWRDFCAYDSYGDEYNGHLNSGDAYRRIGQYLAMHV